MPDVGSHFGRFTIEAHLGGGGMGDVYLARDPNLGRLVALKVVNARTTSREADARLLREARAAAALEHPNAVVVFEVGEIEGRPYIAMEHVRGRSLRSIVGDPLTPLDERLAWLADVARALAAAHRAGIVHRDVKPENVMVRDDGTVKVLDFGIARQRPVDASAPTAPDDATETAPGVAMGTPAYMAPEQIRAEAVDGRTDQFSWAVTAYELLTGALPWLAEGGLPLVAAVLTEQPPAIPRSVGLPLHIEPVLRRALSKTPNERYPTMDALIDAWLASPEKSTSAGRGTSRSWFLGAVAAAAVLGAACIIVAMRGPPARAPAWASAPTAEAPRTFAEPATTVPEARAAYLSAMQAFRDGAVNDAIAAFERAGRLDDGLAAAHLRRALLESDWDPIKARTTYQHARELRSLLTPFDQELLEAVEPRIMRTPHDHAESERRLAEVIEHYPLEPEAHLARGIELYELSRRADALASLEKAYELDPTFTRVLVLKIDVLTFEGDFVRARAAAREALARSSDATGAYAALALMDTQEGHCEDLAALSRRWMNASPNEPFAGDFFVQALASTGAPANGVREALARRAGLMPPAEQPICALSDEIMIAAWMGDFQLADDKARALQAKISGSDERRRAEPFLARARIAVETGRDKDALALVTDYFVAREAWSELPGNDDYTMAADPRPRMIALMRRAGASTDVYGQRRDEWLAAWNKRQPASDLAGHLWMHAYPMTAWTAEDARVALDALHAPIPPFRPFSLAELGIGRMYRLTGKTDNAIEWLERATRSCSALALPFDMMRAWLELGYARETKGDTSGACRAYATITAQWGSASPPSVTATEATAKRAALHCAP